MNPKTKKYLIAGGIGLITVAGALAYLQYKKIMNYVIKFKSVKIKKLSITNFNFDLFLNFDNKSDVGYTIESQAYKVYINNIFVTKLENASPSQIKPKSISVIGLNVQFNPRDVFQKLGKSVTNLLTDTDKILIKIDIKLKVKIWLFTINIPYVYEDTLKNMTKNEK